MIFPKKIGWNMIFIVLAGKIMFLFSENMILHLDGKWKIISLKKIDGNVIFSSNLLKRWSFQEGTRQDLSCIIWKDGLFFPKTWYFWYYKCKITFLKKCMEIWHFLCTWTGVKNVVSRPATKKIIKDGLIPQKYT